MVPGYGLIAMAMMLVLARKKLEKYFLRCINNLSEYIKRFVHMYVCLSPMPGQTPGSN